MVDKRDSSDKKREIKQAHIVAYGHSGKNKNISYSLFHKNKVEKN